MDISNWVTLDTEVFKNYFLVMFRQITTGKVIYFEKHNDSQLNAPNILKLLKKYTVVTFNGIKFDMPVLEVALAGFSNAAIKRACDMSIVENAQPWQIRKQLGVPAIECDHIDLIEVAPSKASLKIYAGRLHAKRMMDLPKEPDAFIEAADLPEMREYCEIDNENTAALCKRLLPELELRYEMGQQYGVDLRSKSDAQVAEAVIKKELERNHNIKAQRPKIEPGTQFKYKAPSNLVFKTEKFNELFNRYKTVPITILKDGYTELVFNYFEQRKLTEADYEQFYARNRKRKKVDFETWKEAQKEGKYKLTASGSTYTLGIGGIHSCEKKISHVASNDCIIRDYDVEAFYPHIILNNKLAPRHLGNAFLKIYKALINKRLASKAMLKKLDKNSKEYKLHTVINESIKIVINGLFGKLGSKWSCVYAPDLMAQVTITGQLTLLMLIERMELAGIPVISANTDGIILKFHPDQETMVESIIEEWEFDTEYKMEATDYESVNSRGISDYIAIKKGKAENDSVYSDKAFGIKGKGAYADQRDHYYNLRTNPAYDICSEAVKIFLKTGKSIEKTISECKDITKFITIRTVNGGAVKDGEYVGKAVRWYYGRYELDAIYYRASGNKVPKSDGAVPLMTLPETLPNDLDYDWYVAEAHRILKDIGVKLSA